MSGDLPSLAFAIQAGAMAGPYNTSVSPVFVTFPATGSSLGTMGGHINVFIDESCAWEARSNASWILVGNQIGVGRGTISYGVENNTTGRERKGTLTVAGKTVTIKQMR